MKRSTLLAVAICAWAAAMPTARADGGSIHVQGSGFRNGIGDLLCGFYASAENFPQGKPTARVKVPASQSGAECVFGAVRPGRYAASVLHDENRNGKMGYAPLIHLPREGYGVSNNKTYSTHAPVFEESAFGFDGMVELRLAVTLRY